MSDQAKKIIIMGLPEAGKTSFLAGLYYYATNEIVGRKMKERKPSANAAYLNRITDRWLQCETPIRTKNEPSNSFKEVQLHLLHIENGMTIDLHIPDMTGESYLQQFTDRLWEVGYKEEADSSEGIILFINPTKIKPHVLIDDIVKSFFLLEETDEGADDYKVAAPTNSTEAKNFDKEEVPTQIILCDLLFYHTQMLDFEKLPVAIIISAWDFVKKASPDITPWQWIEQNMPLLFQYLKTNQSLFDLNVFGISAQGGNFTEPDSKDEILKFDDPGDRFKVQEEATVHNNICAPIEWLITR